MDPAEVTGPEGLQGESAVFHFFNAQDRMPVDCKNSTSIITGAT